VIPLAEEELADPSAAEADGDEAAAESELGALPETSTEGPPSLLLNPASPAVHHLGYACLLIPRLPQHQLHGDLATRLEEWVPQLSLSFGWRMVNLIVQVDRLGWIASMSPEHSPAWMVERIRVETSRRIFTAFPALAEENISGDFWAPGYLVVGSMEWPSVRTINAFMNRTRTWQGFNSPR
jgi:REP element-mobilizing transposase RayT